MGLGISLSNFLSNKAEEILGETDLEESGSTCFLIRHFQLFLLFQDPSGLNSILQPITTSPDFRHQQLLLLAELWRSFDGLQDSRAELLAVLALPRFLVSQRPPHLDHLVAVAGSPSTNGTSWFFPTYLNMFNHLLMTQICVFLQ